MAVERSLSSDPMVSILFFGICLIIGIGSRHVLQGSKVPYTVALLIIGVAIGCLEYGTSNGLGKFGAGIRLWANINADLLLAVFLPALLFEASFSMDPHYIKRCMVQMFLLAGPGVLISTFLLGTAVKLTFPYGWNWKTSLLLGGLLSATDPVAVVALLKDLGGGKKLSTLIEGESLMNDGMAMVVYQLFFQMVLGQSFSVGAMIKYLVQASVGSVGIGLAFGIATFLLLQFIFNNTVVEITLTLAVSYIAYIMGRSGRREKTKHTNRRRVLDEWMAMVVYQLFFQMVLGQSFSVGAMIKYLVQASVGSDWSCFWDCHISFVAVYIQ